jgi:hypothetical protein
LKKYLSAFVCGFGAGVLTIVPVAKSFSCCLLIPIAAYFALLLDRKANPIDGKILFKKAIVLGLLTGLYAALFGTVFDIIITFITKNNDLVAGFPELQKMIMDFPVSEEVRNQVMDLLSSVINQISETGFSFIYFITILLNNLIVYTIFGMIGGLVGAQIINSRIKTE